jgi:hypothetical protein
MTRFVYGGQSDQRRAAERRKDDAQTLLAGRRWRGAMYLMGYVIECTLKSKLMEKYGQRTLPALKGELSRRFARDVDLQTHNLDYLFDFLQARDRLDTTVARALASCTRWSPGWRYYPDEGNEAECRDFLQAAEILRGFIQRSA